MTDAHATPPDGTPGAPPRHPREMTPGEKLAAEWEARHDVRARGAHGNPVTVQEYLQHARSEEYQHPTTPHPHAAPTAHPEGPPAPQPPPKENWLHRLFRRSRG